MNQLLIITNSYDLTTDLLLDRLQDAAVFRFNFDQFASYRLLIDSVGFELSDPTGRTVTSRSVHKAYWRKPFNGPAVYMDEESARYVAAEFRYALSELVNLLWLDRKLVLVEPHAEQRAGKLVQLSQARGLFHVPRYEFLSNRRSGLDRAVVKSLSNELIGEGVLYTTRVSAQDLSPAYPWLVQSEIEATLDVTAVYVRGQLFSFSLQRDFQTVSPDWRRFVSPEQEWRRHALPPAVQDAVRQYMTALQLDYGRLDFLLDANGLYWFCEVNPNGQFAWLDLNDEHGVLSAIVNEISPATERRPLCNRHPLDGVDSLPSASVSAEWRGDSNSASACGQFEDLNRRVDTHALHTEAGT